jgi:hypothetical protein
MTGWWILAAILTINIFTFLGVLVGCHITNAAWREQMKRGGPGEIG